MSRLWSNGTRARVVGSNNRMGSDLFGGDLFYMGIIYLTPARNYANMLATKTALPVLETPTEPKPQPD